MPNHPLLAAFDLRYIFFTPLYLSRFSQVSVASRSVDSDPLHHRNQSLTNLIKPSHPLHNSVIVPLLQDQSPNLPFWLAACYELYQNIIRSHNALESQKPQFGGLQMSGLSRLQRSYMRDNVAAVSKDSTVGAARFLVGMLQAVESYLRAQLQSPSRWKVRASVTKRY